MTTAVRQMTGVREFPYKLLGLLIAVNQQKPAVRTASGPSLRTAETQASYGQEKLSSRGCTRLLHCSSPNEARWRLPLLACRVASPSSRARLLRCSLMKPMHAYHDSAGDGLDDMCRQAGRVSTLGNMNVLLKS